MGIWVKKTNYHGEVEKQANIPGIIASVVIFLFVFIMLLCCISSVPTGYTGILTTFGRVEDVTLGAGVHWIAPWQKIIKLDNRTQKVEINTQTFSSDIQQVDVAMSVNYCIDQTTAQTLYKTVGENYFETVVHPRILENTKSVFAHYTAEELIGNRQKLSNEIANLLTDDVDEYGITIVSFAVEDIDFTDAFTDAVERKQVAQQNKLAAETEQAQKTMEQQAAAERRIIDANAAAEEAKIQAEADLEVTKIQADAAEYAGLKEAAKNKAIAEWLSPLLIRYYYILQWDGKLPNYMMSGDGSMLFQIPNED